MSDELTAAMFAKGANIIRHMGRTDRNGWRPIATAPKDGTRIFSYEPPRYEENKDLYVTVRWNGEGWDDAASDGEYGANPTHWMPLPTPPEVA